MLDFKGQFVDSNESKSGQIKLKRLFFRKPGFFCQRHYFGTILAKSQAGRKFEVLEAACLVSIYDICGGGQGGGRPGEKGAGGVREAGEEGAGSGIPKVAGSGRKREKLCNIAQYFAIEKMQRGGSQKIQGGNRD